VSDRTLLLDGSSTQPPKALAFAINCEGLTGAGRIVEAGTDTPPRAEAELMPIVLRSPAPLWLSCYRFRQAAVEREQRGQRQIVWSMSVIATANTVAANTRRWRSGQLARLRKPAPRDPLVTDVRKLDRDDQEPRERGNVEEAFEEPEYPLQSGTSQCDQNSNGGAGHDPREGREPALDAVPCWPVFER
jgi:hypothetical protein